jgi:hypothetical protein
MEPHGKDQREGKMENNDHSVMGLILHKVLIPLKKTRSSGK